MDIDKDKVKKSTEEFRLESVREEESLLRRMMSKVVRDIPEYSNLGGSEAKELVYVVIKLNSGLLPLMYASLKREQAESAAPQDTSSAG